MRVLISSGTGSTWTTRLASADSRIWIQLKDATLSGSTDAVERFALKTAILFEALSNGAPKLLALYFALQNICSACCLVDSLVSNETVTTLLFC